MTEPTAIRDLGTLEPIFRHAFLAWAAAAAALVGQIDRAAGRPPAVIVPHEARRTAERQAWLYQGGRTRPGRVVTSLNGSPAQLSLHQLGLAADWHFERENATPERWDDALWGWHSYRWIYAAVPLGDFGLETVRDPAGDEVEWNHVQIRHAAAHRAHRDELGYVVT